VTEQFSKTYWEDRYHAHAGMRDRKPNPQLVAEAAELVPGTALDAGCGEGADAIWLAARGWRVTAVDIATAALRMAREHAEHAGIAGIDWVPADLTDWTPAAEHFDLVSAQYVHPASPHDALVDRLAAAVAPGGTLLIVDHHGPAGRAVHHTVLDPDRWEIVVAEERTRSAPHPDGHEVTIRDAVLRARKRR